MYSKENYGITKSLLKTVQNIKNGDLTTEMDMFKFEEQQQLKYDKIKLVAPTLQENCLKVQAMKRYWCQ